MFFRTSSITGIRRRMEYVYHTRTVARKESCVKRAKENDMAAKRFANRTFQRRIR